MKHEKAGPLDVSNVPRRSSAAATVSASMTMSRTSALRIMSSPPMPVARCLSLVNSESSMGSLAGSERGSRVGSPIFSATPDEKNTIAAKTHGSAGRRSGTRTPSFLCLDSVDPETTGLTSLVTHRKTETCSEVSGRSRLSQTVNVDNNATNRAKVNGAIQVHSETGVGYQSEQKSGAINTIPSAAAAAATAGTGGAVSMTSRTGVDVNDTRRDRADFHLLLCDDNICRQERLPGLQFVVGKDTYHIILYLILSYLILSHLISSHLILSHLMFRSLETVVYGIQMGYAAVLCANS